VTLSRILLVEDNEADVLLVEEALVDLTPRVLLDVVRDGEDALTYLRGPRGPSELDFVLLDANTPRMDAVEVLTELRRDVRCRTLPVVVYSSSSNPMDARRVYLAGANAYVAKPVDLDGFMEVIRATVRFWCSTVPTTRDAGATGAVCESAEARSS